MAKLVPLKALVCLLLRRGSALPQSVSEPGSESGCTETGTIDRPRNKSQTVVQMSSHSEHACKSIPAFRRGDHTQRERDIKRLAIAFTISQNRDMKDILLIVMQYAQMKLKEPNHHLAKVTQFVGRCGPFILRLCEIHGKDITGLPSTKSMVSNLLNILRELAELVQIHSIEDSDKWKTTAVDELVSRLTHIISEMKKLYPLATEDEEDTTQGPDPLKSRIDTMIEASITVLDIIQSGCDLIPLACIKPSVSLTCALIKAVRKTRANYQDMRDLSEVVSEFVLSLAVFCSENGIELSHSLEVALVEFTSTLQDVVEQCILWSNKSLINRFLQQGKETDTIGNLRTRMQQAIEEFQLKTQILQYSDFHKVTRSINDKLDGDIIKSLPTNTFFEGNREDFLPDIQDDILGIIGSWIEEPSSPVLLLSGGAGLGKSSISHQLVYHLMDTGRLAAQIFFTRRSPTQQSLITVVQTLAHELASMHPRTVPEIAQSVRLGGSSHQSLTMYLRKYILGPIQSLSLPQPLVIVMDALDEYEHRQPLLQALCEIMNSSDIKIFITSRPSSATENLIEAYPMIRRVNIRRLTQQKMERYLSVRFSKILWNTKQPSTADISHLAKLADGLVIWAATSCNLIGNEMQADDSYELLQKIISCSALRDVASEDQLSTLYHTTLAHLFGRKGIQCFVQVFQAMLVVQESMTIQIFARTFNLTYRQVKAVHSALCALEIYETSAKEIILPPSQRFHASFLEYITQPEAPYPLNLFYIDSSAAHSSATERCLLHIQRFSSSSDDRGAASYQDLEKPLQYAVFYWPFHLINSSQEHESMKKNAAYGINVWTPLYILASRAMSSGLEGPESEKREVDKEITFHRYSLQIFTVAGLRNIEGFSDFGHALWKRYDQGGSLSDLEDSISIQATFLDAHPDPSLQRARALSRMGLAFRAHFISPKSASQDLAGAISALREALAVYDAFSEKHFQPIVALASALKTRYEQTGDGQDLDDAIALNKSAIIIIPPDHPEPSGPLNNLATSLISLYGARNVISDLDEATSLLYLVLKRRPPGHPYRSSTLNNLAFSLQRRFEASGHMADLKDAISMNFEVLDLRPAPHHYRAQTLNNTALCLRYRFEAQGSISDMDEAISRDMEAVELRPVSHPYHLISLDQLANDLHIRFQHRGDPEDLSKAIYTLRTAVNTCPNRHRDYFLFLSNLGKVLRTSFLNGAAGNDLADAVDMQRRALALSPPQGIDHSIILENLGTTLLTCYEQQKSGDMLAEAIQLLRDANNMRPKSHPHRFQTLNSLARSLHQKFKQTLQQEYLEEARLLYNESLQLCLSDHTSRPVALEGLAYIAQSHFELDDTTPTVLDAWIELCRELFNFVPQSNSKYKDTLKMLCTALRIRFDRGGEQRDLDEAGGILMSE